MGCALRSGWQTRSFTGLVHRAATWLLCGPRLAMLAVFCTGCSYTEHYVPTDLSVPPGSIRSLAAAEPVMIANAVESSEEIVTRARLINLPVNYRLYTESAIQLLKRELESNGVVVSGSATKVMNVAILNVGLTKSLVDFWCVIDASLQLGDGSMQGFTSRGTGPVRKAIDSAMVGLVVQILNDRNVRSFLK